MGYPNCSSLGTPNIPPYALYNLYIVAWWYKFRVLPQGYPYFPFECTLSKSEVVSLHHFHKLYNCSIAATCYTCIYTYISDIMTITRTISHMIQVGSPYNPRPMCRLTLWFPGWQVVTSNPGILGITSSQRLEKLIGCKSQPTTIWILLSC